MSTDSLTVEIVAPRDEQLLLVVADFRRDLLDLRRAGKGALELAGLLEFEPRDARLQRARLGLLLAKAGGVEGVVEANDEVVLLDDLADLHRDFLNDAGLAGLDDLGLRRRYDLAVAARDFIDLGKGRPGDRTRQTAPR